MFGDIGVPELLIIFVIALVVFGPRKLPELGKSLGQGIREFKKAMHEMTTDFTQKLDADVQQEKAVEAAKASDEGRRNQTAQTIDTPSAATKH